MRTYHDQDPPPRPQLALPVNTVRWTCDNYVSSPSSQHQAIADLIILAFFFLLRVGEYTCTSGRTQKRTVSIQKRHVTLRRGDQVIPHTASLATMLKADSVTINLENQKNGFKNATLHHTRTSQSSFDPVVAAVRRLHHLRDQPPSTPICTYIDQGKRCHVSATHIRQAIRRSAIATNLHLAGYELDRIGSHSLRASGAMALKLNGYDESTIKKLGRWSGDTYLRYIHSQIGELTRGVASRMSQALRFTNVSI